jgi:hypothetical protein
VLGTGHRDQVDQLAFEHVERAGDGGKAVGGEADRHVVGRHVHSSWLIR